MSFFFLWLAWCSQNIKQKTQPIVSGDVAIPISQPQIFSMWGNITTWYTHLWAQNQIGLSWDVLIYTNIFLLTLPDDLKYRTYNNKIDMINDIDFQWLTIDDNVSKRFNLNISKIFPSMSWISEQILCTKTYEEWLISQSKKTVIIQWKNIYTNTIILEVSGPDIQPRQFEEVHFCFVDSGLVYNFSVSDYKQPEYSKNILSSLRFLK